MALPVAPPVAPMLAVLRRSLPEGADWFFEPKWDGFRCLAFRDSDDVDLRSRNQRPFARYFPEIVDALRAVPCSQFVLDGELVVLGASDFDFAALLARLHPAASRVARLSRETPATYIAFDVLCAGDDDLLVHPFSERRARLESLPHDAPARVAVTPTTRSRDVARAWLDDAHGRGIDGVVAKAADLRYEPGRRAMTKVKPERTLDCVVGGFRHLSGRAVLGSLLLGLYDDAGAFRHIGVASSFDAATQRALLDELVDRVVPLAGHPWEHGFGLKPSPVGRLKGAAGRWTPELEPDWVPVRPDLVCEVAVDRADGARLRHPARFRRWRPDRDPGSCTLEQLADVDDGLSPRALLADADDT
ncbi:MAG TPA: ATP-dependent DNA ligase [Acidimicrobiia bacterium]|nr:ATP-dependent DNA ligase [Acidimicrobiia bacterium]